MNILHQQMKMKFSLLAARHVLSIFDLDLLLQGHISDLKSSLLSQISHISICYKQSLGLI